MISRETTSKDYPSRKCRIRTATRSKRASCSSSRNSWSKRKSPLSLRHWLNLMSSVLTSNDGSRLKGKNNLLKEYLSRSAAETIAVGASLGKELAPNSVVCFFGDLAAGKTTFIKGLASGAANCDESLVQSPTFNYLNIYLGDKAIYHFDLYRLRDSDEFLSMGFDELFEADGVCCIEWSERISPLLPDGCIKIEMSHAGDDLRRIVISE